MVAARQPARDEQDHQQERCRGKADHDGGKHQRLRNRIRIVCRIPCPVRSEHRSRADAQAAHAEDEEVHGIGKQGEADDELVGARAQDKPDAGPGEYSDGDR